MENSQTDLPAPDAEAERGREGARGVVEGVGDHALGEDPRREVEVREGLVGGGLRRGGAARRGRGRDGEEEEAEAVREHGGFGRRALEWGALVWFGFGDFLGALGRSQGGAVCSVSVLNAGSCTAWSSNPTC
jgi:hypothetical protein